MKRRYGLWASVMVMAGSAAWMGCAGDTDQKASAAMMAGSGGSVPMSGSSASGAAGTTMTSAGTGAAGMNAAGAGGTTPAASGSGGSSSAGTTSMMAGSGGTMAPTADAGPMGVDDGGIMTAAGSCGPATTVSAADLGDPMKPGPWTPTMKAGSGPSGSSTLYYPQDLGKDGVLHPVFHWGCGALSQPAQYNDHLNLLASHGFVVIANASGSMPGKGSLDWLLAENEKSGSEFYQKLDPNRVGAGGHSLGALETFQYADDPRLKLYVLVCGGANGGTGAADIHGPAIFLGGEGEGGTVNFAGDYEDITMAPAVFVTKTDTAHVPCARNNLGPWVAFMRWNFCGEQQWQAEFEPGGTYCTSPWLDCQSKGL